MQDDNKLFLLTPAERLDGLDAMVCLDFLHGLERCRGGRIVLDGYNCPHCDTDDTNRRCRAPARNILNGKAPMPDEPVMVEG
jgi:hypothetical protein